MRFFIRVVDGGRVGLESWGFKSLSYFVCGPPAPGCIIPVWPWFGERLRFLYRNGVT